MSEKFLCLIATFDDETSRRIKEIECIINQEGIVGTQTRNIPHHITLAYFDTSQEEDVKQLLHDVCSKTKSFQLDFNHIGLFGLKVLFLAPDVNYDLLELHARIIGESVETNNGLTAHMTLLIDEPKNIQRAIELVSQNFQQITSRVESVSLYEFFPTRCIEVCKFQ